MTVCTATFFTWNYGTAEEPDIGGAILTASDRMLTDEGLGIEYESSRWKVLVCGTHHLVLVAGDYSVMSYAIQDFADGTKDIATRSTRLLAEHLSASIQKVRFERAAKRFLGPLGIAFKDITAGGNGIDSLDLSEALKGQLIDQLHSETLGVEAMVVGCDGQVARLYRVDGEGLISQHDDIGFLSIGSGGIHSSAYFMQLPFDHNARYARAVLTTFLAKKRAEVSPGVGVQTDMFLITANGVSVVQDAEMGLLEQAFRSLQKRNKAAMQGIERGLVASAQKTLKPPSASEPLQIEPQPED